MLISGRATALGIPVRTELSSILKSNLYGDSFPKLKKITQYMYTHTPHMFFKERPSICCALRIEESLIVTPEVKYFTVAALAFIGLPPQNPTTPE